MKKVNSTQEIISELIQPEKKVIIDVGCGIGELARWLGSVKATVIGIDKPELIKQALNSPPVDGVSFKQGQAQDLPVETNSADIVLYMASFHHFPPEKMGEAINECRRVLKSGGIVVFLEPVVQGSSWYEITRFFQEEEDLRFLAYNSIKNTIGHGFQNLIEKFYYIEKKFSDFEAHIEIYVPDPVKRKGIIESAFTVYEKLLAESGLTREEFMLKSVSRVNILVKD